MDNFLQLLVTYLGNRPKNELLEAAKYADDYEDDFEVDLLKKNFIDGLMPVDESMDDDEDFMDDDFMDDDEEWVSTTIEMKSKKLIVSCECNHYDKFEKCKHIDAAIADFLASELNDEDGYITDFNASFLLRAAMEGTIGNFFQTQALPKKVLTSQQKADAANGWTTVKAPPDRIAYEYIEACNLKWITSKNNKSFTKVTEDLNARHWVYYYRYATNKLYEVQIKYDGKETFQFNCSCGNKPGCQHAQALLQHLQSKSYNYFLQFKNYDLLKNKMLLEYGLTLTDPEAADFKFKVDYGSLELTPPKWAVKITDVEAIDKLAKAILPQQKAASLNRPKPDKEIVIDFEPGFLLNLTGNRLGIIDYELEFVKVYPPKANGEPKLVKLDTHLKQNLPQLSGLSNELYGLIVNLSKPEIEKYATQHYNLNNYYYSNKLSNLPPAVIHNIEKYYREQLRQAWPLLQNYPNFYVLPEGRFSAANCKPAKAVMPFLTIMPRLEMGSKFITLSLKTNKEIAHNEQSKITGATTDVLEEAAERIQQEGVSNLQPTTWQWAYSFFYFNNQFEIALPASDKEEEWFKLIPNGLKRIPIQHKENVIKTLVPALEERLGSSLELPVALQLKRIKVAPHARIMVNEYLEKYLMLMPQFTYNDQLVDFSRRDTEIWLEPSANFEQVHQQEAVRAVIDRDTDFEMNFYESLRPLHPGFERQLQNDFYYLPFDQVMQNQWFIKTLQKLADLNVPVFGIEKLKKFRYSALKPKWEMKAGSGTDWFDLSIEVKFGEESIPLKTIKKAFASGQQVIMLNDGSLGVLPNEWLKQYGSLLKMGQEKEAGVVRLSKLHYTLIEALHNEIDDATVLAELEDKKARLKAIETIDLVELPKNIKAKLRPYQKTGFQWMNTLEQLGWGGCLADDMGLGKTLQTITFLQQLSIQFPKSTHLVVCPTSLLYNWENELKKFAPKLKYWMHYGSVRQLSSDEVNEHHILITSYGMVRSDIELLKSFDWHYIILDESQAIKNPDALTTRALHLLKAKNRLILSGTPLQNNTYDLYAQFNFLNPGMLGSREFFREEFANPIDKYNDAHKSETLRRMLHPFMLRRTKAQVAPDLPAKTETILWCDLPKAQRQVYDDYKMQYRQALMQKIDESGMGKAGMLILEGLLRLRQICNSPRLLKKSEYATHASVKVDELLREIEENTGGHKLLVFSQFTEMLHLIEAELQNRKIGYSYLDGSTPANKRQQAVTQFQEQESIRLFLISLKAGGVGLNLTAADYVYLVDPWWNPAAEQQAIDRTHRIGQKQKVFAYKMICRDTVEEKIMELQQRKRKLAGDIVGEDEAIAKSLTKDDVAFLFG